MTSFFNGGGSFDTEIRISEHTGGSQRTSSSSAPGFQIQGPVQVSVYEELEHN